jgi:hypothetical protein
MIRINFNNGGLYEEWLHNCNIYVFVTLCDYFECINFLNSSFQIHELKFKGNYFYYKNINLLNLKYYLC